MAITCFLVACVATLIVLFTSHTNATSLLGDPEPKGKPWKVAAKQMSFVDTDRKDLYNPSEDRKLMVDLFLPVNEKYCDPWHECEHLYVPWKTGRVLNDIFFGSEHAHVFERFSYKSCCHVKEAMEGNDMPVVFLEPAVGVSRLLYTQLARQMSACGFPVVLTDHPYDAAIVEFDIGSGLKPIKNNGTIALDPFSNIKEWNDTVAKAVDTRIADINYLLDNLSSQSILEEAFPHFEFKSPLKTDRYVVVGHGLGGTVATQSSISDNRTLFSINLSGTAPPLDDPKTAFVYFFGREGFTRRDDDRWSDGWNNLEGRATEFDMKMAGIFDMSDLPLIVELYNKEFHFGHSQIHAKGTDEIGPSGFHATSCFVEGYLRSQLQDPNDNGNGHSLQDCVTIFKKEVLPYPLIYQDPSR